MHRKLTTVILWLLFMVVIGVIYLKVANRGAVLTIFFALAMVYIIISYLLTESIQERRERKKEMRRRELRQNDEKEQTVKLRQYKSGVSSTMRKFLDAAKEGDTETVEQFLAKGIPVDSQDKGRRYTALMHAANAGKMEMVKLLIEKGADVNAKGSDLGRTALMLASWEGHTEVVKYLLSKGARANEQRKDKVHALYGAAQNDHPDTVQVLLDNGAEIDLPCIEEKSTALMIACQQGNTDTVKVLVEQGANVNARTARDKHGYTPLVLATEYGFVDIARILVEAGADINSRNGKLGHTPLMVAALHEYAEMVTYLLKNGADATLRTEDGKSTLSFGQTGSGSEEEKKVCSMLTFASAERRKFKLT